MKSRGMLRISGMALVMLLTAACGDDDGKGESDGAIDGGAGQSDAGEAGLAEGGGTGDAGPSCGNGELDELEQCDDGDLNNNDGCTTLCEFSCEGADDCDDGNLCNGQESCAEDHTCGTGKELADGTECGPMRSCWAGICVDDVCGDATRQGEEECDDGDLEQTDGCTTRCEFSCVSTDGKRDCSGGDECAGADTCDDKTHTCTGTPLADKTDCTILGTSKDGWCMKGVCVPTQCGDGKKAGQEECDEGKANGTKGSGCSIDCRVVVCGNGYIEVEEQCDDGNNQALDGCDAECKAEFYHRLNQLIMLQEPSPEFCAYPGKNRFGEAFPGKVEVLPGIEINVLDFLNQGINGSFTSGDMNALISIEESTDTSMRTSDKKVIIGLYNGIPEQAWEDGPPIDFPFLIRKSGLNSDGTPEEALPSEQTGGGRVVTTEPTLLSVSTPVGEGNFELEKMMMRVIFDVQTLSAPEPPPKMAKGVVTPEESGKGDPSAEPYLPDGRLCGAQPVAGLKKIPVFSIAAQVCCKKEGGNYRECPDNKVTDECDSLGDIILNGCYMCFDPFNPSGGTCTPGCGYAVVEGIDPDVDTDGDGKNDSFTTVMAFDGTRVRAHGVTDE